MTANEFLHFVVLYSALFIGIGGMVHTTSLLCALIKWVLDDGPDEKARAEPAGKEAT